MISKKHFFKALSLFLLLSLLFCACESNAPKKVSTDVIHLSAILSNEGYATQYFEEGNGVLPSLADEMESSTGKALQGEIKGYLFVQNGSTGESVMEVFVFEKPKDAQSLYNHLKDNERFVEGESECRIDYTVVYMGYISALELIEDSALVG
ncbi:MAG: hypothetical protein J6M12_02850 [Clostridia bacterium]|nr:hypothetical protein [Clostridia bacterium]